jgi:hypothetical protein
LRFFLGLIIVLGRALGETFGATGAAVGAIFVGIADIDAITVSMARLTPETLSASDAALAILAAVASNTVSKVAIGAAIGRGAYAIEIAAMARDGTGSRIRLNRAGRKLKRRAVLMTRQAVPPDWRRVNRSLHRYVRARRAATRGIEPPVPSMAELADFFFAYSGLVEPGW